MSNNYAPGEVVPGDDLEVGDTILTRQKASTGEPTRPDPNQQGEVSMAFVDENTLQGGRVTHTVR